MKHIEPDFLRTKLIEFENYKPDIPSVGIFDEPTRCYPINKEWASIVMGLVSWLTEPDLWENADDERYIAIQAISDFLVGGDCMSCEDIIDCLETDANYQAFQYQQFQTQLETTQDHLDQLEQQYDNTPQSINPVIPSGVPNATEQDALCYALEQFVKLYAVVKLNLLQRKNSLQVLWDRMRTAVVKLYNQSVSLLGFNPSNSIFSCFVDDTTAISALQSDGSLLAVACCLRDELQTVTISQTTFDTAISTCLTQLTGTQHDILCLLDNDNNLQVYLSFLEAYGVALERQIAGETLTCNCGAGWCYISDFENSLDGWTVLQGNYPYSETGYTEVGVGSTTVEIQKNFSGAYVQSMTIEIFGVGSNGEGDLKVYSDGVLIYDNNLGDNNRTFSPQLELGLVRIIGTRNFAWGINAVQSEGVGTNPFGADNC